MSTQPDPFLTLEQYLEIERNADFRSEYLKGEVFAMAGGTRNHAWIASNILIRLGSQLYGKSCGVAGSDVRLYIPAFDMITYPDLVVTCGPDRFLDGRKDTLVDAMAIVEVLSPSTRNYDRSEKFLMYRSLPSFSEYLTLEQAAISAEHWVRQSDGSWLLRDFTSPGDEIELKSIGCRLNLGSLYDRVEFETTPS